MGKQLIILSFIGLKSYNCLKIDLSDGWSLTLYCIEQATDVRRNYFRACVNHVYYRLYTHATGVLCKHMPKTTRSVDRFSILLDSR